MGGKEERAKASLGTRKSSSVHLITAETILKKEEEGQSNCHFQEGRTENQIIMSRQQRDKKPILGAGNFGS